MNPIRILIADDHEIFRDGLRTLFDAATDIELVGQAKNQAEVCAMAEVLSPDIILMDIHMPPGSGIDAMEEILAHNPAIHIIMFTMFEDDQSVFTAMRLGAKGYLLKGGRSDDLLGTIRIVAAGGAVFSPAIAQRMTSFFDQLHSTPKKSTFPELSERENEVLALLTKNFSNAQIAAKLVISDKTVRNHVSNILRKLQVANRVQAAAKAREMKIF